MGKWYDNNSTKNYISHELENKGPDELTLLIRSKSEMLKNGVS